MEIALDGVQEYFDKCTIDPEVHLVQTAGPHEKPIAHLAETHSGPQTAQYLLAAFLLERTDVPVDRILDALEGLLDTDSSSEHFGSFRWYLESPGVVDSNAGFFVTTPLALIHLLYRDRLAEGTRNRLESLLRAAVPCFMRRAAEPGMFYPNAHLGDCVVLLALGSCLDDKEAIERGRQTCLETLEYWSRRGWGWGEDHSAAYGQLLAAQLWMVLFLAPKGELHDLAEHLLSHLIEFFDFHDGCEPVPAIRSYNQDGRIRSPNFVQWLLGRQAEGPEAPWHAAAFLLGGRQEFRAKPPVPRSVERPLFNGCHSTSYVGEHARLGTISRYPEMTESYMTDTWGLGWQSFPVSFIAADHDHGFLRWINRDGDGVVRAHPTMEKYDFESRCLFPRLSFHPQVITVSHQVGNAAIVLREIHRLHTNLEWLEDRWVIRNFSGRLIGPRGPWNGRDAEWVDPGWLALEYDSLAMGIYPLLCKRAGDQKGAPPAVRVQTDGDALNLSIRLAEHDGGEFMAKFLCGGWCIVLAESLEQLEEWRVTDRLYLDGEQARPEFELVRSVELAGPLGKMHLRRDPLDFDGERRSDFSG